MLSSGEYIVDFCYMFFIVLSIYFYYNGIYKTKLDYILGILAIIIGLLVVFFRKKINLIFAHVFYSIYLVLVTLFSNNYYLLGLNVIMLINIILTRYFYDGCLLVKMREKISIDAVNYIIDIVFNYVNGDYYYLTLLFVSMYRLLNILLIK